MPLVLPQGWIDAALEFFRNNSELASAICFALGFGESIAFVSLLVPSTALFLGIGGAVSAAGGAFWPIWLAGAAGAFVGDILSYAAGRYFKNDIVKVWPFTRYPDLVPKGRAVVERWGGMSIIGGKFIGALRPFIPVAAGMMDMPWGKFLIASAISCQIWAGVFLAPGFGLAMWYR